MRASSFVLFVSFCDEVASVFPGQAILLESGIGFFGDGALDEPLVECWIEIVGTEGGTVRKLEAIHALHGAKRLGFQQF